METLTLAYLLILLGLALLIAEVFLPSGGILFALALVSLLVGITLVFTVDTSYGFGTLLAVFLILPLVAALWFYIWPKTPLGRKFFLQLPPEDTTLAHSPTNLELENLRGRYGKTVSPLRPSGVVDFDGQRVDTLSEGAMIAADEWVKCVDVQAGKVVVRKVDGPPNLEDIHITELQ